MGGQASAISTRTKAIFVESAYFSPSRIAKTSQRLGLQTDAAFRYARGTDPALPYVALRGAIDLLVRYAGVTRPAQGYDCYPRPVAHRRLSFRYKRLKALGGCALPRRDLRRTLKRLEIEVLAESAMELTLAVPPYRQDVQREVDVIEEVLRVVGYDKLDAPLRLNYRPKRHILSRAGVAQAAGASLLVAEGFCEMLTAPFVGAKEIQGMGYSFGQCVGVLGEELGDSQDEGGGYMRYLRPSLLPTALQVLAYNRSHKQNDLRLFEWGKVYEQREGRPFEEMRLVVVALWRAVSCAVVGSRKAPRLL